MERRLLLSALAGHNIEAIEHFGSTAVEGLSAKPVIDILILVASLSAARAAFPAILDRLGYDFWRDNPKTHRLFFVKGMPPRGARRTHHIHVFGDAEVMRARLRFRDHLRANAQTASEYETLKTRLAVQHSVDRDAYTNAKSAFISGVLSRVT